MPRHTAHTVRALPLLPSLTFPVLAVEKAVDLHGFVVVLQHPVQARLFVREIFHEGGAALGFGRIRARPTRQKTNRAGTCQAQDTGHRTQGTGHRTQDTGHRPQDTGCAAQAPAQAQAQGTGLRSRNLLSNPFPPPSIHPVLFYLSLSLSGSLEHCRTQPARCGGTQHGDTRVCVASR